MYTYIAFMLQDLASVQSRNLQCSETSTEPVTYKDFTAQDLKILMGCLLCFCAVRS